MVALMHTESLMTEGNLEENRRNTSLTIARAKTLSQNTLIESLLALGYSQSAHPGESCTYKREGSTIRLWHEESEYMIEYFDDEIDGIIEKRGDTNTHCDSIVLAKASTKIEVREKRGKINTLLFPLFASWSGIFLSSEFLEGKDALKAWFSSTLELSSLSVEGSEKLDISKVSIESLEDLKIFLDAEKDITIYTRYAKRVTEFLHDNQFEHITVRETREMVESFSLHGKSETTIIGDDIISKIFLENRVRKASIRNLDLLLHIREWDLIVHREHGIGKYIAVVKKRIGLTEREYMETEYASDARIYVPLTELHRITKYVGESSTPLSSLDGKEWERALSKTEEEVEIIARDILETSARRALEKGIRFGSFPAEEKVFEKAFAHEHTPDQRSIIEDIRTDMESDVPMDRLISGDVGFGKTEIAMNAIYKAVLSGMQVAVISPLLVLAEEHYETFEERLGAFWVRIASLTRMTTAREEKHILEAMKSWDIDVVVGTHRLLSEDVRFRRLGLLVIDEEHRFWVSQKEAIKRMKAHIDILSLSATPIPRSLNMALSGLKKISLLTTPPRAKKPIETIISRWDEGVIAHAIEWEVARGGQVIVLHNRIASLAWVEEDIQEMMRTVIARDEAIQVSGKQSTGSLHSTTLHSRWQEPRIITLHGRMTGEEIEDRIHAFKKWEYDILISTTVIENGVNFLGANTMIVSDAEEFWLAQLHQIRGRVGRKDIAGTCYLMYRKYELSGEERERLMILAENSSLGSGWEIAMRDLEMRGTGDILGFRQSGKTKEVGISLYFQLLEEKVDEIKNWKKKDERCKIELDLSYAIDDEFFDSELDKLSFFRDIDSIETLPDLEYAESTFRVESMPESMTNLFLSLRSSIILTGYSVKKVSKIGNNYHFDFHEGTRPDDLRRFIDRFDKGGDMIIVSITKIRIETGLWRGVREFLEFLTR
jgi:transcription-repair coupling factor (superfamily II helicase)